jgi:hypothetical protein
MEEKLFGEFQKYVKETFGYDVVNVEPNRAVTFKNLFGGSFIENEKSLRLPDPE